jgi:hypothetical protein
MWMVDPKAMCRQHLLGEHVELHMLVGHLRRGRHVRGFVERNFFEAGALQERHDALAVELSRRGYRHDSPLDLRESDLAHLSEEERRSKVNSDLSFVELRCRCEVCRSYGEQ